MENNDVVNDNSLSKVNLSSIKTQSGQTNKHLISATTVRAPCVSGGLGRCLARLMCVLLMIMLSIYLLFDTRCTITLPLPRGGCVTFQCSSVSRAEKKPCNYRSCRLIKRQTNIAYLYRSYMPAAYQHVKL